MMHPEPSPNLTTWFPINKLSQDFAKRILVFLYYQVFLLFPDIHTSARNLANTNKFFVLYET